MHIPDFGWRSDSICPIPFPVSPGTKIFTAKTSVLSKNIESQKSPFDFDCYDCIIDYDAVSTS